MRLAIGVARAGVGAVICVVVARLAATAHQQTTTDGKVIHTTAIHPWLTADHGWVVAGKLRVGESVRLLDDATASVVALRVVVGVGPMWDLTLADVHAFAVGDAQAVVHNCPPTDDDGRLRGGDAKTNDRKQINGVANDLNMTPDQRRDFGKYVEMNKRFEGRGGDNNYSYQELLQLGQDFLDESGGGGG